MAERILIADDDPVQRRLVENMVTRFGYETVTVDSGDAALTALADTSVPIDGVVLDLVMPDLDGLGVLAKMRERDIRTPVIVQTAHGGIDNVISAMRAGAVDFVVKPASARTAASLVTQRARCPCIGRRNRPSQAQPIRHADVQGHHYPLRADADRA